MLAEYNSVAVLPVIGNEINLNRSSCQFSKVELSKKDMQNFLINGSVSKEFIQTNKKELQKFIKSYTRSGSQHVFFKGYNDTLATQKRILQKENNFVSLNNESTNIDTDKQLGTSMDMSFDTINS